MVVGGSSPKGDLDIRRASVVVILDRLDHSLLLKLSDIANKIPVIGALIPDVENTGRTIPQNVIEAEIFDRLHKLTFVPVDSAFASCLVAKPVTSFA